MNDGSNLLSTKSRIKPIRDYHQKAIEIAKKFSPNTNKLKAVQIDERTTIYIRKNKSAKKAKQRFIERLAESESKLSRKVEKEK
jgi:hypothetical protein